MKNISTHKSFFFFVVLRLAIIGQKQKQTKKKKKLNIKETFYILYSINRIYMSFHDTIIITIIVVVVVCVVSKTL